MLEPCVKDWKTFLCGVESRKACEKVARLLPTRTSGLEEFVCRREQDGITAGLASHIVPASRQSDGSTAVSSHSVVEPSTRTGASSNGSGARCSWMCWSRSGRLGHIDGSRVSAVVEHGKTDRSVISRSQVVILRMRSRLTLLLCCRLWYFKLTFRPFICLYRFLQPSPTTHGKGLSFSSASSNVRPSMAMA